MKRKKMSPLKDTGYTGSKTLKQVETKDPKEKTSYPKAGEGEGANIERKDDEFIQSSGGNETGLARFEDYFPRAGKRSIERKKGRAKAREEMDEIMDPMYRKQGYEKEMGRLNKRGKKLFNKLNPELGERLDSMAEKKGALPKKKSIVDSVGKVFDGKEVQGAVGGAFNKLFMRSAKYKK